MTLGNGKSVQSVDGLSQELIAVSWVCTVGVSILQIWKLRLIGFKSFTQIHIQNLCG